MSQVENFKHVQLNHAVNVYLFQQNATKLISSAQNLYDTVNNEIVGLDEFKASNFSNYNF